MGSRFITKFIFNLSTRNRRVVRIHHCPIFFRGKWSDIQRIGEWVEPSAVSLSDFNERQGWVRQKYGFEGSRFETLCECRTQSLRCLYFVTEFQLSTEPLENVAVAKSWANQCLPSKGEWGAHPLHSLMMELVLWRHYYFVVRVKWSNVSRFRGLWCFTRISPREMVKGMNQG
jgi:hypothetical protein